MRQCGAQDLDLHLSDACNHLACTNLALEAFLICEASTMNSKITRKFLLINPNTNAATTQRLQNNLRPMLPEHVELEIITAGFGSHYIACEASHAVASHACLQAWADHRIRQPGQLHGVLIGCFGDPGLFALREACACRVTGLAEASFILGAQRGPFAVVTGGERWKPMLQRLAQSLGYGHLLRHIETVAPNGASLQADPDMAMRCLADACKKAATKGVESVILGGAGLAGYAHGLRSICPLPLIDSAEAGLRVLLQELGPAPLHTGDGFFAQWHNMEAGMMQVPARP